MTSANDLTFGGWIKRRRAQLNLTPERLAELVGCPAQTIRSWEDGRRPSHTSAERLAEVLAIPAAEQPRFLALAAAAGEHGEPAGVPGTPPASSPRRAAIPAPPIDLIGREAECA